MTSSTQFDEPGEGAGSDRTTIARALDAFAAAWRRGERPAPEAFVPPADAPDRRSLLADLLLLDLKHRLQAGEAARVEDYLAPGRFPIRVELTDLNREDFLRILTEPKHALTKQYAELLATEGVQLEYTPDGIEALADIAFEVNRTTQNIGARRLHTILERVVEEVSYEGPDLPEKRVVIDGAYVRGRIGAILQREDLSKFIL